MTNFLCSLFKKIIFSFALFLWLGSKILAQDLITLKNGSYIEAIVLDSEGEQIKYRKFNDPAGPNFFLNKSEVNLIRYQNGKQESFKSTDNNQSRTPYPVQNQVQATGQNQVQNSVKNKGGFLTYKSGILNNNEVWSDGKRVPAYEVRNLMAGNSEALNMFNSGKSFATWGDIIAYPSAFLFGWHSGWFQDEDSGSGAMLALGAGGMITGIVLKLIGTSRIKSSLKIYNSKLSRADSKHLFEFSLSPTGAGLCLSY